MEFDTPTILPRTTNPILQLRILGRQNISVSSTKHLIGQPLFAFSIPPKSIKGAQNTASGSFVQLGFNSQHQKLSQRDALEVK